MTSKIAIVGYGNVGKGVHKALYKNSDMELTGILTRDPERTKNELIDKDQSGSNYIVRSANNLKSIEKMASETDVAILCGGSATDLPKQGPLYSTYFNTVDSFDTHGKIPEYGEMIDSVSRAHDHTSLICGGWDPGVFSNMRTLIDAILPGSKPYGFYGLGEEGGLSMGHSDAIRRIEGVKDARQYTHAIPEAMEKVRSGENPDLEAGDMHWRDCKVVLEKGADKEKIANQIKEMPDYYKPYKTEVEFVSQEKLDEKYSGMPHDGVVLARGETGDGNMAIVEYKNQWKSNPEATGSILVACARGCNSLNRRGNSLKSLLSSQGLDREIIKEATKDYFGAYTMSEVSLESMSPRSKEELYKEFI